ncbi:unnamed protein product [Onchocerca ochengi]|uniref:Kinesin motor domain-containing protein n=1 Tax=Onchocerca ochengi TaxID=42157 RepID=A0A182EK00_ONCOC|nr:unnamed protein product [Onchocerca ochengi]
MLNDKAEIIWSNDDITTSRSISQMGNDKKFVDANEVSSVHGVNTEKNEGQRSTEAASSSSFLAVNSASRSHFIVIMLGQYISVGWLIFKFC